MRINWSWIIVIAMAAFIGMIVSMGVIMWRSDSELYEGDYYQKGEEYAQRMEEEARGRAIEFNYDASKHSIELRGPEHMELTSLRLIRLSNASEDFTVKVVGVRGKEIRIPIKELKGEDWVMELSGRSASGTFFKKERL